MGLPLPKSMIVGQKDILIEKGISKTKRYSSVNHSTKFMDSYSYQDPLQGILCIETSQSSSCKATVLTIAVSHGFCLPKSNLSLRNMKMEWKWALESKTRKGQRNDQNWVSQVLSGAAPHLIPQPTKNFCYYEFSTELKDKCEIDTSLGKHTSSEKYEDRDQPFKSVIFYGMMIPNGKKPRKRKIK